MGRQAKLRKHRQRHPEAASVELPAPLPATEFVAAMSQQGYTLADAPPAPPLPDDRPSPQV